LPKDDSMQFDGVVIQARGNGNFLVRIDDNGSNVSCSLSGRIRKNSIRILEGDRVRIEVSPYSTDMGRIIFRNKLENTNQ